MNLLVFAFALAAPPAGDVGWPEFRGPHGNGIADATGLPTKWDETTNIVWKAPIHDKGWSSPIVFGEQVWVTTAEEEGKEYYAVCLDRRTGKVIHDLHLFSETNPPKIKQFNTYASPTPCIANGKVYAHFGSHGTACIEANTGKVLWDRRDLPCNHWRGPASSPVVYGNRLFLQFDGHDKQYLVCLDKDSGTTLWKKDRDLPYPSDGDLKKGFATPAVFEIDGKVQVVSSAATGTLAYDAATGDEIWRVITGGMNQACRPILAHGLIYLTTGHSAGLWAVTANGTGDKTKSGVAWKHEKTGPTRPSPLIVGPDVFFVNDTGTAFCLDAKTGKKIWQETLDGKFSSSPVFADGKLYFVNEAGKSFVVEASREYKLLETNKLDAGCKASPAVVGGQLFLRTFTHLYCIGGK